MDIDERHCPNCGHDILNWDVVCPGCDQVPWNSPAGRRIVAKRRRKQWWLDNAFALTLLASATVAVVGGGVSLLNSPGSFFCPLPGSDPQTRALLQEIETLVAQLQQPELPAEQREAARARLSELLQHDDRIIRQTAAWALAGVEIDALAAQLEQPELSAEQREAARSRLMELFQQDDDPIRRKAGRALADLGDPRGIQWLIDQLDTGDRTEQLLARVQLERVTGQGEGWNRAAWKRWWKAHKDGLSSELASRRETR